MRELAIGPPPAALSSVYTGRSLLTWTTSSCAPACYLGIAAEEAYPVNILFSGPMSLVHPVVLEDSGINTLADIKGKTVSLPGGRVTSNTIFFRALQNYYGWTSDDVREIEYVSPAEMTRSMIEGIVDMGLVGGAPPHPSVVELESSEEVRFLSVDDDFMDYVIKYAFDEHSQTYERGTLPPNTYEGQTEAVNLLAEGHIYICRPDVDEHVAYTLVKTLFDNEEELETMLPAGYAINLESALGSHVVPYHPGAVKYYKERGVWTAEHEAKQAEVLEKLAE